jgi:outer membrane protein OmpA-like peptidoglycan-associated protein
VDPDQPAVEPRKSPESRRFRLGRARILGFATALVVPFGIGCASMTNAEKGAAGGAAAGAAVGGVVGNNTDGSTAKGAIIGAVVGGAAGALIGQRMDRQAEELDDELENGEIERVGEGIEVTFDSGLLFDFDSSDLRDQARANLADLAENLDSYEGTDILVVGHTDSRGSEAYNMRLSERRAESAEDYLIRQGISPDRIRSTGLGESEPEATNETEVGRQENRRVEVAVFASEEYREEMVDEHGGDR